MCGRICFTITFITALAITSAPAFAQSEIQHNNIIVGGGAAIPAGNATQYLSTAPMFTLGYGYRFTRLFQADAGFQMAFGAANNQNVVQTALGPVQGGDHELMIPLGGRIYIPAPFKRIQVSAGGGGIYLHYSETAPSSGYYQNNCYTCTSRGGWGGYGLLDANYALDSNHNWRIGTTFQYVAATTSGQAVGNVASPKSTDHWGLLTFYLGLSF